MSQETTALTSSSKFTKRSKLPQTQSISSALKTLKSKSYTIFHYCEDKLETPSITLELNSNEEVSKAIVLIVKELNRVYGAAQKPLKEDTIFYSLHFSKKNGKPKEDLPGLKVFFT